MWARDAAAKARLLAKTFADKWQLPPLCRNRFSVDPCTNHVLTGFVPLRTRMMKYVLSAMDSTSATGPDGVPTRVLKECATEFRVPLTKLICRLWDCGEWPDMWKMHRICPLHKKKSRASPGNYRGIQLTSQVSKAAERVLAHTFVPTLSMGMYGDNQFAYREGHGARDALLYLVLTWLLAMANGKKIVVYCSDVQGAFDKVCARILTDNLKSAGIPANALHVVQSWLGERHATVAVHGKDSEPNYSDDGHGVSRHGPRAMPLEFVLR